MAEPLFQPLSIQVPIVDPKTGAPTPYFQRLMQELGLAAGLQVTNGEIGVSENGISNAQLADMASKLIKARKAATTGDPEDCSITEVLDFITGTPARGDVLYRGASAWSRLAAGTSGQFLKTNGPGADPAWATVAAGGGGWTEVKLASDYVNATTTFSLISDGVNSFSYTPPANSDIEIEVAILAQTVAAANLPKFQITVPGGLNNTQYGYSIIELNQTTGAPTVITDSFGTAGSVNSALAGALPTSGEPWPYKGVVKLRTGSSPAAITFEGGAETAAANACTIKAGSSMRYRVLA